ncbi:MAG: MvaI/BcnI family restriction endonuclease [Ignavibacteria bacterium]|nr:MvaI/BcnI family restriction endonuclease [Ignavibacteria bacterium]
MKLIELKKKLIQLSQKGFVKSQRKGPTGIGHLVETELGLKETNISIPDIGGRVEIKSTREDSNSPITLFTFNRGVWKIKQSELINKYGYVDEAGRQALYSTVSKGIPNQQQFYYEVDLKRNLIVLKNKLDDMVIAEWSVYVIAGKFMTKLDRLLFILAKSKIINSEEYYHFHKAYLLEKPTPENFLDAFNQGLIFIDIRMHLKSSGGVRNHGTGFRIKEKQLITLYQKKTIIL